MQTHAEIGTARLRWARKVTLATTLAAMCIATTAMIVPPKASAGTDDIVNGWVDSYGLSGPRHSLSSIWTTRYLGANNACANALNADGSGWAGATICATPGDSTKNKNYCACQLRYGWGFSADPNNWVLAWIRQHW